MKTHFITLIILLISAPIFSQTYTINQGGSISTCSGSFYDSGGNNGDYLTNEDYTMTFCSATPGQQIHVLFTTFNIEKTYEFFYVYDGPNTSAPLILTKNSPSQAFIVSSTNGCLTFHFTSDGSMCKSGWQANISCGTVPDLPVDSSNCIYATPFCTDIPIKYDASVDVISEFGEDVNVGCLGDTPNPTFFYIKVGTNGNIPIHIKSEDAAGVENDVDFICWGPFNDPTSNCIAGLTTTSMSDHDPNPPGNIIDCSYDIAAQEDCTIPNAQVGEYYLLLITNFENVPSTISFGQNGGTGATDCSVVTPTCNITDLTATPSVIDPATGTYTLSGSVTFVASPPTGTLTVSDNNGNSQTFTPPFVSPLSFNLTGLSADGLPHNITASFSDSVNCTNTITITAPCPANATISGNQTICNGASADLTIDCKGTGPWNLTYTTNGANPQTISINSSPYTFPVNPTTTSTYTITGISDINCTGMASGSVTVTVLTNSNIDITPNNPGICLGDSIQLNIIGDIANSTYLWSSNPGLSSTTISNPIANPTITTIYSLTVTSPSGCISIDSITLTVNTIPDANFSLITPVCAGVPSLISYIGNVSSNAVYNYEFFNSSASDLAGIGSWNVIWNNSGDYLITLVVTENGCVSDTTKKTITILPNPQVNFSSNITEGCAPIEVQFENLTPDIAFVNWNFGDPISGTNTSNLTTPSHIYSHDGSFDVTLNVIDSKGCISSLKKVDYITAHPIPTADFIYRPSFPTSIDLDVNFYSSNSTGNITQWSWNFGDYLQPGEDFSDVNNPTYSYHGIGSYNVTLIVTTDKGCKDTLEKTLVVKEISTFYIPNAFSPNNDGKNDNFGPKGIELDSNTYKMSIYNRWGQLIFNTTRLDENWNGCFNNTGEKCSEGIYNWIILVREKEGIERQYDGFVTLIR